MQGGGGPSWLIANFTHMTDKYSDQANKKK